MQNVNLPFFNTTVDIYKIQMEIRKLLLLENNDITLQVIKNE